MEKVISLRLDGDFSQGFWVTLDWEVVGQLNSRGSVSGRLGPDSEIAQLYTEWRRRYRHLEYRYRLQVEPPEDDTSEEECHNFAERLKERLNTWLNSNPPPFTLSGTG